MILIVSLLDVLVSLLVVVCGRVVVLMVGVGRAEQLLELRLFLCTLWLLFLAHRSCELHNFLDDLVLCHPRGYDLRLRAFFRDVICIVVLLLLLLLLRLGWWVDADRSHRGKL